MTSIFDDGLEPVDANHAPLSPIDFIARTASVYPDYPAVIHGNVRRTWQETYQRCRRLASALDKRGVGKGDTVAAMLPNIPEMLECHFGVPMLGAVLNALNTRLDAEAIAFMLEHGEAKVLIVDREFCDVMSKALALLKNPPLVIDVNDPELGSDNAVSELDYEAFLNEGDAEFSWHLPEDEWQAISLCYTSGTTGNPKGVVYHHRGAYENALGNQAVWSMGQHPVYLWTLPMFHCNGWCFPWTITAFAGTHVCLRKVEPEKILQLIHDHDVTHMCGAPIVLNTLLGASAAAKAGIKNPVRAMTAGAAPPAKVIEAIEQMGIYVTHVYGLTEVYGPVTVCAWKSEWDKLPVEERAAIKARQGVRYHTLAGMMVGDPETMEAVPQDGKTIGEIFLRGNTVMKGYLKNPKATAEAFRGGWSTIEVEGVLYRHPAILEAAVVARPDEKWGETPCAFVTLKPDAPETTEADIISFCRENMAKFKAPKTIVFCDLPKTSTGKIQKFVLRDQATEL